ncbi:hypothetical protein AY599_21960 [Leptolyngbya valderiana BDU 20041]|nr:hypothetical protein AY599_21960 [Leptolyngbya valderiana BDU 20041]
MWEFLGFLLLTGVPQAALALIVVALLAWTVEKILRRRGPAQRLARAGDGVTWGWLYGAIGLICLLGVGYADIVASASSTAGIGLLVLPFVALIAAPPWLALLGFVGAAAGRLGHRSTHVMLLVATLTGVAVGAAGVWTEAVLVAWEAVASDGAALPMLLATLPLASVVAALVVAPFLPVGRFPAGHCINCGYDLAGLPPSTSNDRAVRCPECGYHPSAASPRVG